MTRRHPPKKYRPAWVKDFSKDIQDLIAACPSTRARKKDLLSELDLETFLALFAAIEGQLRVHMRHCVESSRLARDELAIALRGELTKAGSGHVTLDAILNAWKAATRKGKEISKFSNYIRLRDWLAHGRATEKPENVQPDVNLLFAVAVHLCNSVKPWPDPRFDG